MNPPTMQQHGCVNNPVNSPTLHTWNGNEILSICRLRGRNMKAVKSYGNCSRP